jgi:hypothetical protein
MQILLSINYNLIGVFYMMFSIKGKLHCRFRWGNKKQINILIYLTSKQIKKKQTKKNKTKQKQTKTQQTNKQNKNKIKPTNQTN